MIFDPAGLNETPLKYTAGMVLAISVDAEVSNVADCLPMVRLAIKTPDQKVQLVTPKTTHFFRPRGEGSGHRLLTDALMSHQVRGGQFVKKSEGFFRECFSAGVV